jgi:hypothetical protein
MSHHAIILGGDTEWFEQVSEDDYRAAVTQLLPIALGPKASGNTLTGPWLVCVVTSMCRATPTDRPAVFCGTSTAADAITRI